MSGKLTCRKIEIVVGVVFCGALLVDAAYTQALSNQKRALRPKDIVNIEGLADEVRVSPDGELIAFERYRSLNSVLRVKRNALYDGRDRGDIWLISVETGKLQRITRGARDNAGFWAPSWSPDGKRLAMLSDFDDNVRVWLWERRTGRLRMVSQHAIDEFSGGPAWLNEHTIVFPALAKGEKATRLKKENQAISDATRAWERSMNPKLSSSSVLDSGLTQASFSHSEGGLLSIDLDTGRVEELVKGDIAILPSRRSDGLITIFELKQSSNFDTSRPLRFTKKTLAVSYISRQTPRPVVLHINGPLPLYEYGQDTISWSPDRTKIVFVGVDDNSTGGELHVFAFDIRSGRLWEPGSSGIHPGIDEFTPEVAWSRSEEIAFRNSPEMTRGERRDWWLEKRPGELTNLTQTMAAPPTTLLPALDSNSYVGISSGRLIRIPNVGGPFEEKWAGADMTSFRQVGEAGQSGSLERLVVALSGSSFRVVDLKTDTAIDIQKPTRSAELMGADPSRAVFAFKSTDENTQTVWLSSKLNPRPLPVFQINGFLRDVFEQASLTIDYKTEHGIPVHGWILLPAGYRPGERYPLIVEVYAGSVVEGSYDPDHEQLFYQRLLCSHGYAVLVPSMPLAPEGTASDPMLALTDGVLPGIDKAVELGVADPQKVGVIGASYGGYSVYGLISQTPRFRAAVAIAGLSDLASYYGTFSPNERYSDSQKFFSVWHMEGSQGRMGSAPWKDPERYVRNSPLFRADQIETPLMIIQGDMDYVPLQQGEELFTALRRQNKRVRFVRYWGEGHTLQSPANIEDIWQRIYAWFDEFLKPGEITPSPVSGPVGSVN